MSTVKQEPVVVAGTVAAVLGWVATFLVSHGVVTATVASHTTQAVAPSIVSFCMLAGSVVLRRYVSPAVAGVERTAAKYQINLEPVVAEIDAAAKHAVDIAPQGA